MQYSVDRVNIGRREVGEGHGDVKFYGDLTRPPLSQSVLIPYPHPRPFRQDAFC